MTKEIRFKEYDATKCDIGCADGEIAYTYGINCCTGNGYTNQLTPKALVNIPEVYKPLIVHKTTDGYANLLATIDIDGEKQLFWCQIPAQHTVPIEIDASEMTNIGAVPNITGTSINGDKVVVCTGQGQVCILWANGGYRTIHLTRNMPTISIGLQAVGDLHCSESVTTDTTTSQQIGLPGSGASRPHSTAPDEKAKIDNIGKAITDIYTRALNSQVTSKGYLHQPIILRYAYRLYDGTYINASGPILLLPTTLPPIIQISTTVDTDNKVHINIDLTANKYYELRYRINQDIGIEWRDIVASVDIFASAPIMTHKPENIKDGYISNMREIVGAMNGGTFGRTHRPSRATDSQQTFIGHYSEANDNYTDHTADLSNMTVWYVAPNAHLQHDITSHHEMHLITSIPYAQIKRMDTFSTMDVMTSDTGDNPQLVTFPTTESYIQQRFKHAIPTASITYAAQTIIASNRQLPIAPLPLEAMAAYSGCTATPQSTIKITAYIRHNGALYKSATQYETCWADLSDEFPRNLYHPDPDTCMLSLSQGANTWLVSMTPTPDGSGAYWWGGLDTNPAPETANTEISADVDAYATDAIIYISRQGNPLSALSELNIGAVRVTALTNALSAPQSGRFGQYPLYAFTTGGIFMLQYRDAYNTLSGSRLISHDICTNPLSTATVGNKVIYQCGYRVKTIEGSKISDITPHLLHGNTIDINTLPHIDELLRHIHTEIPPTDHRDIYGQPYTITYQSDIDTIILSTDTGNDALIMTDGGSWSILPMSITTKISSYNNEVLVDTANRIIRLTESDKECKGIIVTRPIKDIGEEAYISQIEVTGRFKRGNVGIALYGANHLDDWHVVCTSSTEIAENYNTRHYRYHVAAIVARLDKGEYIHGISLTTDSQ